jgi:hypothetical protein
MKKKFGKVYWQGKYLRKITLGQAVAKPGDSHFGKD